MTDTFTDASAAAHKPLIDAVLNNCGFTPFPLEKVDEKVDQVIDEDLTFSDGTTFDQ